MKSTNWPKVFPVLSEEQQYINDDFMKFWHEQLANRKSYRHIEKFNHQYAVSHAPKNFLTTLEIGAGLGEHFKYEKLSNEQKRNYVAVELRENMAQQIREAHPEIQTIVGDCQEVLPYLADFFDRILAIHVLEHLPNLPSAIKEMYRLVNKTSGVFSVVIPCEGGFAYSLARKISAQRFYEKRYKQPYKYFIEREHINLPHEIFAELDPYFEIITQQYFPLFVPLVDCNLCIGITFRPRSKI